MMDTIEGESWKRYMLHYNFPSFSVGEVGPFRGPGRREIGHGHLAERAIRGDQRALRRLRHQFRGPVIKSRDTRLRALPSNDRRTSRGTVVHNLGGRARLRESAGSIELLGDPSEAALEQLVRVAKQRFGTRSITLLGPRTVRQRPWGVFWCCPFHRSTPWASGMA